MRRQAHSKYHDFDALVDALRAEIGAAQRKIAQRMQDRLQRKLSLLDGAGASEEDLNVRLAAAEGNEGLLHFPAEALQSWQKLVLQEVEFRFEAALEVKSGPTPLYALIFDPKRPMRGLRKVQVAIRMVGVQPGRAEVLVEGQLLKVVGSSDHFRSRILH